ncbi:MAG TPA: hypothetical protein VEV17_22610 [Bryobacteraceae bacterium]|nr:hypothetical protein [Bryobacteraceae bacterium]
MTELKVAALESLQLNDMQELVGSPGPCVTLLLPPYRPGAQAQPAASILKTQLQEAVRQLGTRRVPESVTTDLMAPLRQLTEMAEFQSGSNLGCAIFRSSDVFAKFDLMGPVKTDLTVGGSFYIRPILAELHLPAEFYLLKLSKKGVALLRCAHLRAEPVAMPKGVPETLEEAMEFKPPDHDLFNRSTAGPSVGAMQGVTFGTGSGREKQHAHLADFYKAVDRGIEELLRNGSAPLVLAGVEEDIASYRLVNTYKYLVEEGIHGSPGNGTSQEDLLRQAHRIIREDSMRKDAAALAEARERVPAARFSIDLNAILAAAVEGRIHRLYLDQAARKPGVFHGARRGERWDWGEEDLLNVAAVETILQGGVPFSLPGQRMPAGAAAAAILRY